MDQFIFNLDTPFLLTAAQEVKQLATVTLEQEPKAPVKFQLALDATQNMLTLKPVTQPQIQAILDVIGGYYCSVDLLCKKYGGNSDQLSHAKELMRFAGVIVKTIRPHWKLQIVEPLKKRGGLSTDLGDKPDPKN